MSAIVITQERAARSCGLLTRFVAPLACTLDLVGVKLAVLPIALLKLGPV